LTAEGLTAGSPAASVAERAEIARQVRSASTSFYWAMRLLAKPRREAMFAVYA
jgi:phytoene synthase